LLLHFIAGCRYSSKLPGQEPVVFGFVDLKRADQIIEKYVKTGEFVDGIIPVNYETIDSKE